MSLPFSVASLDGVDEKFHGLYAQQSDGSYRLDVEGVVPEAQFQEQKSKVDEFRANNTKYLKDLKNLKAKYDGVDPDKFKELAELQQKIEEKKLLDEGKVDELIAQRVDRMKSDYEQQLKKRDDVEAGLNGQIGTMKSQLANLHLKSAVADAFKAVSDLYPSAMDDVMTRASGIFQLNEQGSLEPRDASGNLVYGKDSKTPLQVKEWAESLRETAPHLFKPSQGGGAQGGAGSRGGRPEPQNSFEKIRNGIAARKGQ